VVTTAPTGDADLAALLVVGEGGVSNSRLVAAAMTAAVEATTVLDRGCLPLSEAPSSARCTVIISLRLTCPTAMSRLSST
jgi:hypothetical protein